MYLIRNATDPEHTTLITVMPPPCAFFELGLFEIEKLNDAVGRQVVAGDLLVLTVDDGGGL